MATIRSFKDLLVWQASMKLAIKLYEMTRSNSLISKDFSLKDQMQRAAVSIPSNIAEGFDRRSTKDMIRFLYISKGSCAEFRTQLYLILELKFIPEETFCELDSLAVEIQRMLGGLIKQITRSSHMKLGTKNSALGTL